MLILNTKVTILFIIIMSVVLLKLLTDPHIVARLIQEHLCSTRYTIITLLVV